MNFLNIAQVVPVTQAEGPGKRFALWLQGCPMNCLGCCNPEMIPFSGGVQMPVTELCDSIQKAYETHQIEGITIMGGEPFSQPEGLALLTAVVQEIGLSVMIFTGYTLDELADQNSNAIQTVIAQTDLLIDGRYEATQPDDVRRWIGSRNQQIHFLTSRYSAEDRCWQERDTLEIRFEKGEISLNGFPAKPLSALWTGRSFKSKAEHSKTGDNDS